MKIISWIPAAVPQLPFLAELVLLFVVSVAAAYLCHRIKLVPIVGYLLAGLLIGPEGLALVYDRTLVDVLAEIGVILLLFTIGLEFSLEKLFRIGKVISVGGTLQVVLTILACLLLVLLLGGSVQEGLFVGFLVALSSTAIVMGLLAQRGESDTPTGRLSLAILIFQDLAVVAMVLLLPILAGEVRGGLGILLALGKAVALILVVILLARRAVPWLLEKVAQTRSQELFLLAVVAICFGTATLASLADISLALGAFFAGLVVSESHYSEHALGEILPLKTIFTAVFFVSIGMLLDFSVVLATPWVVVGLAVLIVLVKLATTSGSILVLGYPLRIAAVTGFALAQVGEFSFVLQRTVKDANLFPAVLGDTGEQIFLASSVLLMLSTPFLLQAGVTLARFRHGKELTSEGHTPQPGDAPSLEDHVIVVGYGRAGRRLVQILGELGIKFVVIDLNPSAVRELHGRELPAIYGDAGRPRTLQRAGVEKAKLCVVVINDSAAAPRIVLVARFLNPTLETIVRARYISEVRPLGDLGADIVVPEEMETTVRIFSHVLGSYMIPPEEIERHARRLRGEDYGVARGSIQEAHLMVLQGLDEEGLHTRAVAVREGAPAAGRTLMELSLRRDHGLTVLAVRREGKTAANPSGDFRLLHGDRLVMVGMAEDFASCAELFRTPTPLPPDIDQA